MFLLISHLCCASSSSDDDPPTAPAQLKLARAYTAHEDKRMHVLEKSTR